MDSSFFLSIQPGAFNDKCNLMGQNHVLELVEKPGRIYMKEMYTTMERANHMKRFGNIKGRNGSHKKEKMAHRIEREILDEDKYHNLTREQWQWAVSMIKEFELNQDGARILIEEIKKGNFVFE